MYICTEKQQNGSNVCIYSSGIASLPRYTINKTKWRSACIYTHAHARDHHYYSVPFVFPSYICSSRRMFLSLSLSLTRVYDRCIVYLYIKRILWRRESRRYTIIIIIAAKIVIIVAIIVIIK